MGTAELGGVGLARVWLDLSGEGKTKPDRPEFDPGASPPRVSSLSTIDLWAACCLAALDWGLRCAEPLARPCMKEDLHSQYHFRNPSNGKPTKRDF